MAIQAEKNCDSKKRSSKSLQPLSGGAGLALDVSAFIMPFVILLLPLAL